MSSQKRSVGRPRKETLAQGALSSREMILAAAAHLFAERGFEAASLDLIAGRAGYSMGAIYHHFAGKPDLLVAVVDYALQLHDFPTAVDGEPADIEEWLKFAQVYLDPKNRQLRRLVGEIHAAADRYPEMADRLVMFSARVTGDIIRSIDAAKAKGLIASTTDSTNTARMFMVNCAGLVHIEAIYPATMGDPAWAKFVLDSLRSVLGIER